MSSIDRHAALPATDADWHRRVWKIAAPIIIANLSVPLVGMVDTAVVGHLPNPVYIGAVSLGAIIVSFLFWGFSFLRMSTTGFVAQAYGVGNREELHLTLVRALVLALILGIALVVLQWPISWFSFFLLEGDQELEMLAARYFHVRVWSSPAVLANFAILGFLIGIQNTRAALILQLLLNGINVVLDLWFVKGFGWGVEGVALASLIAEFVALAAGLAVLRPYLAESRQHWTWTRIADRQRLRGLMMVNLDIFLRNVSVLFTFAYFIAMSAAMGQVVLAANTILMHFFNTMAYGLDGFAHAAETLTGSAYGACRRVALRRAVFITTAWAGGAALLVCAIFWLLGEWMVAVMTGIPVVRETAAIYLPWVILGPCYSVWSFQLDGIFVGTTHTRSMRNAMFISLLAFLLAIWWFPPMFGNHGLWLSMFILMITRAITLSFAYPAIERDCEKQTRR